MSVKPRTIAIGDVHGCSHELSALLDQIKPAPEDTLVFLGDYIDRGPDSRGVVDLVLRCQRICKTITLCGNHEAMFLDFLERPDSPGAALFILNGGSSTLANYSLPDGSFEMPEDHVRFFTSLATYYANETHFFVHAGVPERALKTIDPANDRETMLWVRDSFLKSTRKWEKHIVHGHTPVEQIDRRANRSNLDTGCVYGGKLTALEWPSEKAYQVQRETGQTEPVVLLREEPKAGHARIAMRFTGRVPVVARRLSKREDFQFETLNYNPFGLLMRETSGASVRAGFVNGDAIEGVIGDGAFAIEFSGVVVRTESRGPDRLVGVRIDRITNDDGGRRWVERPGV